MPRNTFLLVIFLTVFAAVVAVVNFYRFFNPSKEEAKLTQKLTPTPQITISPIPAFSLYSDPKCGIEFSYPVGYRKIEDASGSAILSNDVTKDAIIIACQESIARPAIGNDKIEFITVASLSATLYHETVGSSGGTIDKVIFRNPMKGLDILIAGLGPVFVSVIHSIQIIK